MYTTSFRTTLKVLPVVVAMASVIVACTSSAEDLLSSSSLRSRSPGITDSGAEAGNPNRLSPEEEAFRAVSEDLLKNCGKTCHDTGAFSPTPPTFLAGPDVYKSIKAHPGVVVRDVYASVLLTKGPHAGPAVSSDPDFEKRVVAWLEAEAVAIQSQKLPTTSSVTITAGPNDIDLSAACVAPLTGVHLKFDAAMVDSILSLSKLTLVVPVGQDAHVLQPRFVRVLPKAGADGKTDIVDPADSFSNSDQTVPNGKETALSPGSVLFSASSWQSFDFSSDKLRVEFTKLEPGNVGVIAAAATCKDAQAFATNVLPTLRGQQTSSGNTCQGCHGAGLGGLTLGSQDNGLVCQQILQKLNQADIGKSLIVTKVTGAQHGGGAVPNTDAWRQLFVNNAGVFF